MSDLLERLEDTFFGIRHYTVKPGDNLATLSVKFYGTDKHAMVIFQHNRDIVSDPNTIYPGMHLAIPHIHCR